jgi:hypothetical protein
VAARESRSTCEIVGQRTQLPGAAPESGQVDNHKNITFAQSPKTLIPDRAVDSRFLRPAPYESPGRTSRSNSLPSGSAIQRQRNPSSSRV